MRIQFLFILSVLIFSLDANSCSFKKGKKYISLSGPISQLLQELNLIKDLNAVSAFNQIELDNFKGDILGGGLLLSPKYLKKIKNGVVFYDSSRESRKTLQSVKGLLIYEIKSRGKDPFETYEKSKEVLKKHIIDCEKPLNKLDKKVTQIRNRIKAFSAFKYPVLFYMGEIKKNPPYMIMNRDGFVLHLINRKILKSYPSDMDYVTWSTKIVNKMKEKPLIEIGLVHNSLLKEVKVKKLSKYSFNIFYSKIFIPGISQIFFLDKFLDQKWPKILKRD